MTLILLIKNVRNMIFVIFSSEILVTSWEAPKKFDMADNLIVDTKDTKLYQ